VKKSTLINWLAFILTFVILTLIISIFNIHPSSETISRDGKGIFIPIGFGYFCVFSFATIIIAGIAQGFLIVKVKNGALIYEPDESKKDTYWPVKFVERFFDPEILELQYWCWNPKVKGKTIDNKFGVHITVPMHCEPITENPKVRRLKYEVGIAIVDGNAYMDNNNGCTPYKSAVIPKVKSALYDFNEDFSKKLAEFFNPLNKEQQSSFHQLVKEEVGKVLGEEGIGVMCARFELA